MDKKRKEYVVEVISEHREGDKLIRKIDRTVIPKEGWEQPREQRRDKEIHAHSPLLYFSLGFFCLAIIRALLLMD